MGALDAGFGALVPTLLKAFSSNPATFTRSSSVFDPAADSTVTTTLTAQVITSPPEGYSLRVTDGRTVMVGDRKVMTGVDYGDLGAPKPGDEVSRGEMNGTIISISPINSGDAVVAYELQLRTP